MRYFRQYKSTNSVIFFFTLLANNALKARRTMLSEGCIDITHHSATTEKISFLFVSLGRTCIKNVGGPEFSKKKLSEIICVGKCVFPISSVNYEFSRLRKLRRRDKHCPLSKKGYVRANTHQKQNLSTGISSANYKNESRLEPDYLLSIHSKTNVPNRMNRALERGSFE